MGAPYDLAPEYRSLPGFTLPANRWLVRGLNALLRLERQRFHFGDDVAVRTHTIASAGGAHVPVLEIAPRSLEGVGPALIDFHGGAFCLTYASAHLKTAQRCAQETGSRVFLTDYRLSIDAPFPAAFDDCFATLAWVHERAKALSVDRERVALIGDSAGGALAAGVAQKAVDVGGLPLCGQVLIYPVTDHRTESESAQAFTDTPLWRTASNRNMWRLYLPGAGPTPPAYAAPLHRERFDGLPPARVEIAEFDPLRDEGRQYAEALEAAGVPTELAFVRGAVHGYDGFEGPVAEAVAKDRIAAIQRFFARP